MQESANGIENVNFVIRDLQYSSILDVPFYTRLLHHSFSYFGKINTSISAPSYLGYIYYIIIIIQSFLPAFLVDCEDLWPRNSLMTTIFYVLDYFFQGPHTTQKSARIPMSLIIAIIFIILFAILIIRTQHFHKTGRVSSGEIKFIYYTFKYIMPLLCPHLMVGVPISFDQMINQNKIDYNILQIILSIISFVFYIYLLFVVITPRVLLEDTPTHDWIPFLTVATVANTTILSVIAGIAGCVGGKNRSGCSIWILIQTIFLGLLFFFTNGVIKTIIGNISSATFFASAFISLLLTIDIFISKPLSPEILLIASLAAFIVFIILIKVLKQLKVTKTLVFFDNLMNSGDLSEFENAYKRPYSFLFDIQAAIEIWIQNSGKFEIFDMAVSKWPTNFNLLLLYSRLLAIFPDKDQQLILIVSKISNIEGSFNQTAYLYQFRNLLRRRTQTSMTPLFQSKLDQIKSKTEIINDTLKRFWENVLQKNTINFWSDSEHIFAQIEDLDSLYIQLLDEYPNNYQILSSYHGFVTKIKRDFNESCETAKKMEILKKNGSLKSNLALEIAIQVFPQLDNCTQQSQNNETINRNQSTDDNETDVSNEEELNALKQNINSNNNNNNNNEVDNDSRNQLDCVFSELIEKSKLGIIWITCVILVVITIVVIVLFYIYIDYFKSKFIKKQQNAIDFIVEVQMLCHEFNFFCVNVNLLPLVFEDEVDTPISIKNRTIFTESIAPELFSQGKIPEFSLTTESLTDLLSIVLQRFARVVESLSLLNQDDDYVIKINNLLYHDTTYGSTLNDLTIGIINYAYDLLKVKTLAEYYSEDSVYYTVKNNFLAIFQLYSNIATIANSYAASSYDSSYNSLNDVMTLVILVNLFLISLPYLIQLFLLIIQSESIAESFSLFPNTEIRSIVTDFGKESSKIEDSNQVNLLNNISRKTKLSITTTVLTFLASFVVVLICSLIIFMQAKEFISNAETTSLEIYTLTPSFASLSLAFTQAFRFYMIAHDGDIFHMADLESNLYASNNDNLTQIVDSVFSMLNLSYKQFSEGLWSENGGMNVLIKNNKKSFDYFENIFPNEYEQIAPTKAYFEELATSSFYESISSILDFIWFYIIDMKAGLDIYEETQSIFNLFPCVADNPNMNGLIYWFSNFSEINRTKIYFDMVKKDAYKKIDSYETVPDICFYVVIIWQIIACVFMILFLINRHIRIKKSLSFYKFVKPEIVLQNQNVLGLIETGRKISTDNDTAFSNAEYIISRISQGVVITKKNFSIIQSNDSFIRMCQASLDEGVNGEILTDLLLNDDQDKSWPNFIQHVEDSISGKNRTQFKEDVTVKLKNDVICHFNCTVICLTKNGVSNSGDYDPIEKVAFIFDDNTEIFMKEQLIMKEKKHLNEILSNSMPSRIIHNFVNSHECISFIVQSVSIGMIRIKTMKKFNNDTYEAFTFYDEIFNRFDAEIKQFDLLNKINNFSHTYSFIGGLFSEINKPERHAEEAIKFSLRLLSIIPELSEKYGAEIHLTIGVHTGGPIVAGVLSFDNPTFQIIGTVNEMANQVKNKGVQDQICVTRAVYELIFSASFKVQEQGDTKIRGGKIIPTYLVRL